MGGRETFVEARVPQGLKPGISLDALTARDPLRGFPESCPDTRHMQVARFAQDDGKISVKSISKAF
jgi:hypothetical protein